MASLNYGNWIGRLGKDPESKQVGGTTLVEVSIAVSDRVKKNGEWVEATTWLPCKVWGRTAEILCEYTRKGSEILVCGALREDSWDDKQTGQKRSKLYVNVDKMQLLGGKPDGESRQPSRRPYVQEAERQMGGRAEAASMDSFGDDVPF